MQIHRNEVTTGILVLVTLTLLLGVLAVIGMPGLIKPLNTYRIYYDNANGIREGAPVLLAGREIGKVMKLSSPVPVENRPPGHPDYEVAIDVQVDRHALVYRTVTARLTQQGLMGQEVIDFVHGDTTSGAADNHAEFVGQRVPDLTESVDENLKRLTGPGSDLSETIKSARIFVDTLNNSHLTKVISNAEQFTNTIKREPWRLIWPSSKEDDDDKSQKPPAKEAKKK